jgi:hypothetical protein
LPALKNELEFLKEAPNHPLQQAILDLHKAFEKFFEVGPAFRSFAKKVKTIPSAIRIPALSARYG